MQIRQYNVWYINKIIIKKIIISKNTKKQILLEDLADITTPKKLTKALSSVDLVCRHRWAIIKADTKVSNKSRFTELRNY